MPDHADRQITVLHIGKYFPPDPGGMETYLKDLMAYCQRSGVNVSALVHQSRASIRTDNTPYQAVDTSLTVTRAASWLRVLFTPISPAFPLLLNRLLAQVKPDVLHLHLPNPSAFWVLLLPAARRRPWIIHWQSDVLTPNSSAVIKWCYRLYKPFESALLKRAHTVITTSENYLNTSPPLAPIKTKSVVIPLGIEDRFGPSESRPASGRPLRVLAVGRFAHYKGLDILLRAIAATEQVELDLVGSGELSDQLTALCHSLRLNDRVRFHGAVDDRERDALLRNCDCLCLSSTDRTESFGIVLLEAMSAGKACVISDVPGSGMTSVVEANATGLIVKANDSKALAAALTQLSKQPDTIAALGQHGRQRFEQHYTIAESASAVIDVYDQLRLK